MTAAVPPNPSESQHPFKSHPFLPQHVLAQPSSSSTSPYPFPESSRTESSQSSSQQQQSYGARAGKELEKGILRELATQLPNPSKQTISIPQLTVKEAQTKFIKVVDEYMDKVTPDHSYFDVFLLCAPSTPAVSVFLILSSGSLIAFFVYSILRQASQVPWRAIGALVEGILLLALTFWNALIEFRERNIKVIHSKRRIERVIKELKNANLSVKQDIRVPLNVPTLSLVQVVRSQIILRLPYVLIMKDDLLILNFGEKAPCHVAFVSDPFFVLEEGQVFTPELFEPSADGGKAVEGLPTPPQKAGFSKTTFYFRALENPVERCLDIIFHVKRPVSLVANQFQALSRILTWYLSPLVFMIALGINIGRFVSQSSLSNSGIEVLGDWQVYAVLPLLNIAIPSLWLILQCWGNAKISYLFDALQSSKTAYKDEEGLDDFDAVPPPIKNVIFHYGAIWKKFLQELSFIKDGHRSTPHHELVESLASVTVLCCVDREGSISMPWPAIDQMFFFDDAQEPVVLDITDDTFSSNGIRFEDIDWAKYLPHLRPTGLNILLHSECSTRKFESHRKLAFLPLFDVIKPSRQTCLCSVSRECGFSEAILSHFPPIQTVNLFAPYHSSITDTQFPYHLEIPSVFSTIFDSGKSQYQVFSEGTCDLLIESCGDYWNGKSVVPMSEEVERKIFDFYLNALIGDMQVVMYTYRPLENLQLLPFVDYNKLDPVYVELPKLVTPEMTNSMISTSLTHELADLYRSETIQTGASTPGADPKPKPRSRPMRPKVVSVSSNTMTQLAQTDPASFYQQMACGQTFLSMASFSYAPKPNLINFIEDMALAGVRFVYFSRAPERESKAYAERLGLEVDWNACIILSSEDGSGRAYLDPHDLKARMPRGIEKVRFHIENVDDVPLHVSLFAECVPVSMTEMVQIFQEYGDIVCCIGSSLNHSNVECFSKADVSIAIDPIYLSRSSRPDGAISPMVLSSHFITTPCALTLNHDTSFYCISQLIRESRSYVYSCRQAFFLYLAGEMSLTFCLLLSYCLLLPPLFTGYQLLWMLFVILPLGSWAPMFTPIDEDTMTTLPIKNNEHLQDRWRFFVYYLLRFSLPVVMCVFSFALVLSYMETGTFQVANISFTGAVAWSNFSEAQQWHILFAQNCALFLFTIYHNIAGLSFLKRTKSILECFDSLIPWLIFTLICLCLQAVFFAISLRNNSDSLFNIPWWLFVLSFLPALLIPVIQETMKMHDCREWDRFQKRSKLQFNTKLGMHSPI